ncbi:hypothetical protein ONZ45_g3157 [Pleurotus djamor]|nr:hypothetical protein ONZ45_g3157 [Pleurotus djamor]
MGGIWSPPPVMMQHMEEAQAHHRGTNNTTVRIQRPHNLSWYSKILAFFGYGRGASHQRRLLVSLLWNLALGFAQFVVIVALLAVAATTDSPTSAGRVALACILTYWGWVRDRDSYQSPDDVENTPAGLNNTDSASPPSTSATGTASRRQSVSNNTPSNRSSRHQTPDGRDITPPRPLLYTRLSLLSSLVTLSWFLTAHILEYTSVNTCRFSSPHLWWLVFSILCLMYIMVLEVVLIGFVVFIIAPILFLFWNILLMCLGRHPLQNPGLIKPEIGKLPRSVVDRIPLVMYIPPSPEDAKSPYHHSGGYLYLPAEGTVQVNRTQETLQVSPPIQKI